MEQDNQPIGYDPYRENPQNDSQNPYTDASGNQEVDPDGYYVDYRSETERAPLPESDQKNIKREPDLHSDSYYYNSYEDDSAPPYESEEPSAVPNNFGTVSMVLGIIGLITAFSCCCSVVSIVFGIAGIIFGILAKDETGKRDSRATAGIVMSAITILVFVIMIVISMTNVMPDFNAGSKIEI